MNTFKILSATAIILIASLFIYLIITTQNSSYTALFFVILALYLAIFNFSRNRNAAILFYLLLLTAVGGTLGLILDLAEIISLTMPLKAFILAFNGLLVSAYLIVLNKKANSGVK